MVLMNEYYVKGNKRYDIEEPLLLIIEKDAYKYSVNCHVNTLF